MEQEKFSNSDGVITSPKNKWTIIITIIFTSIVVGGGVYLWQNSIINSNEQKVVSLENQIEQLTDNLQQKIDEEKDDNEMNNIDNDWKKYKNSKYGYEVEYPKDWFNFAYGPTDRFTYFSNYNVKAPLEMGADGICVTIQEEDNKDNLSLDKFISKNVKTSDDPNIKISIKRDTTINGIPMIIRIKDFTKIIDTETGYMVDTYLEKGDKIYIIKGLSFTKDVFDKNEDKYNHIINSFVVMD